MDYTISEIQVIPFDCRSCLRLPAASRFPYFRCCISSSKKSHRLLRRRSVLASTLRQLPITTAQPAGRSCHAECSCAIRRLYFSFAAFITSGPRGPLALPAPESRTCQTPLRIRIYIPRIDCCAIRRPEGFESFEADPQTSSRSVPRGLICLAAPDRPARREASIPAYGLEVSLTRVFMRCAGLISSQPKKRRSSP